MKRVQILLLFLSVFSVVSKEPLVKRKSESSKCKVFNDRQWDVRDFQSIISWNKQHECASNFSNYTVELCKMHCEQTNNDWTPITCLPLPVQDCDIKVGCFRCVADIDAESSPAIRICYNNSKGKKHKTCSDSDQRDSKILKRSSFSAPNIAITDRKSTSFTVNIKEPTEKFLDYCDPFKFTIKVAEITNSSNKNTCQTVGPDEQMKVNPVIVNVKTVSNDFSKNDCSGQRDQCLWKVQDLNPETSYCVFGNYKSARCKGGVGFFNKKIYISAESETGYNATVTLKEVEDFPSLLVVLLISVTLIIILLLSSIAFFMTRRWMKPIKEIDEMFSREMQKKYEWMESLSDSIFVSRFEIPDKFDQEKFSNQERLEASVSENQNHVGLNGETKFRDKRKIITRPTKLPPTFASSYKKKEYGYDYSESSSTSTAESESSVSSYVRKQRNEINDSSANSTIEPLLSQSSRDDSVTIYQSKGEEPVASNVAVRFQCSRQQSNHRCSSGIEEDINFSQDTTSQFFGEENMLLKQTRNSASENTRKEMNDIVEGFSHPPQSNGYRLK